MDGAVGLLGAALEAFEVFERAAMNIRAQLLERLGIGVGAGEAQHLVPVGDQLLRGGRADKSGRAGDEYTHGILLC